jgi:tetratricopeptide (TPR) repeat protein
MVVLLTWTSPVMAQEDEDNDIDSELEDIAQLFIEKKQFAEALKVYDELREANPDSLDVLDMTIELCTKVPSCSKRLPELYAESLDVYEGMHLRSPDNLDILDMNFELCLKIPKCKRRLPELLVDLEEFVKRNPNSIAGREMLVGYALDFKDFKTARRAIEGLVKLKPNDVSNWLWLADYHEQARDFRKLDALIVKLLKQFPKNPQIWLLQADRAIAYQNIQRAQGALAKANGLIGPKDIALRKRYDVLSKDLKQSIESAGESDYVDYRQDTRWSDLEDDFDHSTYP